MIQMGICFLCQKSVDVDFLNDKVFGYVYLFECW